METIIKADWARRGIRYGLIAGLATIAWLTGFYLADRGYLLTSWVLLATWVFYLWAMYRAAAPERDEQLRTYIRPAALVFVIANALYYSYFYALFAIIDPGLQDLQIAKLDAMNKLKEVGGPEALRVSALGTFISYCSSLLGGFGLACLLALALRNR